MQHSFHVELRNVTAGAITLLDFFRSQKLQNETSPNFSNFRAEFCPEFCSEFCPNFSRSSRASFRGKQRPEKNHQKSPQFFNANFPGKFEEKIHKSFLESGQSNTFPSAPDSIFESVKRTLSYPRSCHPVKHNSRMGGGKFFYLQLELFCSQLSFFAFSPWRRLLDARSHCKQKNSNCK